MSSTGSTSPEAAAPTARAAAAWSDAREQLRARGLRWTPQRRMLVDVLSRTDGHVTGAELVERCRQKDPSTIPSTVYRTLDVLEELGLVRHAHGPDGREQYHVLPETEHGHLHCSGCGASWDIGSERGSRPFRRAPGWSRLHHGPDPSHGLGSLLRVSFAPLTIRSHPGSIGIW